MQWKETVNKMLFQPAIDFIIIYNTQFIILFFILVEIY